MKRIEESLELEIIESYKSGMSMKDVGEQYKISNTTVFNILNRYNIPKRTNGGIYKIDEEKVNTLYFKENKTLEEIANIFNVFPNTIRKITKKHPDYSQRATLNYKDINLNHDYFSIIDSAVKAYILGYLIADGNVYFIGNTYKVRCEIQEIDKPFLETVKKELNTEVTIRRTQRDKGVPTVSLCVTSKQMFNDLSKYGVVPDKTQITFLPVEEIPKEYMRDLLRGLLDGDGFTSKHKVKGRKNYRHTIGYSGNQYIMNQIKDYLVSELGVYDVKVNTRINTSQVIWCSKRDVCKIRDYLYKDAKNYLDRKYIKIKDL